ncbi:MAG: family 20 glycosylhydrolase [Proteobacteria bacterium]|nr:family 20 glycosylhydrolase [Pseudomonadota bacterium]
MPKPAQIYYGGGQLAIDHEFQIAFTGYEEQRLIRAVDRMLNGMACRTGLPVTPYPLHDPSKAVFAIDCKAGAGKYPGLDDDESYILTITTENIRLEAGSPYGVLHGLETFLQLIMPGNNITTLPVVIIKDKPRFPWRGLLFDVVRHWMPVEVIKRNLDGMAAMKMNVLHWHLTDDQAVRVESPVFPLLHQKGSDGCFYTHNQIREVLEYATDRGIRIVPEFDLPGHSTSWVVAYPELGHASTELPQHAGIYPEAIDPTRELVFEFLDKFVEETSTLFPDEYWHFGGDEVPGTCWPEKPEIRAFMDKHGMKDKHDLQVYFNSRLLRILAKYKRKGIGWEEILHPDLASETIVEPWSGSPLSTSIENYSTVFSVDFYLDHMLSAGRHYASEMTTPTEKPLKTGKGKLLGGEATMWAELVSPENVDSRVWPRTAAIAERLWSPADVRDIGDMYRRLIFTSRRLEWLGLTHLSSYPIMLKRLAAGADVRFLKTMVDILRPSFFYPVLFNPEDPRLPLYTKYNPLIGLADTARPESEVARKFEQMVDSLISDTDKNGNSAEIRNWLEIWLRNHQRVLPVIEQSPLLDRDTEILSRKISDLARLGIEALEVVDGSRSWSEAGEQELLEMARNTLPETWKEYGEIFQKTDHPILNQLNIMIIPAIGKLVEKASSKRTTE